MRLAAPEAGTNLVNRPFRAACLYFFRAFFFWAGFKRWMPSPTLAGRINRAGGGGLRKSSIWREASSGSTPRAFICFKSSGVQGKEAIRLQRVEMKVEAAGGFEPPNRGFA